jgi:hypothetical protein
MGELSPKTLHDAIFRVIKMRVKGQNLRGEWIIAAHTESRLVSFQRGMTYSGKSAGAVLHLNQREAELLKAVDRPRSTKANDNDVGNTRIDCANPPGSGNATPRGLR